MRNLKNIHKLTLVLGILLGIGTSIYTVSNLNVVIPSRAATKTYDVVIVGGGMGGIGAAVQAAKLGSTVAILEETDWLGGQAAAAGVASMDEGYDKFLPIVERDAGVYNDLANIIYARYGGIQNVHKCYWNTDALCPEPLVLKQSLEQLIINARTGGRTIDVLRRTKVTAVQKSGNRVTGVTAKSVATGIEDQYSAKIVIDATEYGDVLPLAGVAYRVGRSNSPNIEMNACVQDITYSATIKKYSNGIPNNLKVTVKPANYDALRPEFVKWIDGRVQAGGSSNVSTARPWSFAIHNGYRGMADINRVTSKNSNTLDGVLDITKTALNIGPIDTAVTNKFIEDPVERKRVTCEAKLKTIALLYYIQNELKQNWSVADDQGYDTNYNTQENSCAGVNPAFNTYLEIEKRMAQMPYVRESRRMIGLSTVTSAQVYNQKVNGQTQSGASIGPVSFLGSLAIGAYPDDFHKCSGNANFDMSIDSETHTYGHARFQVPFEALIPQTVDGFLAAEKNFSQSRTSNAATRLQPVTMLVGQAVGALAGVSVSTGRQPRDIKAVEVQKILGEAGSKYSLYVTNDVPKTSPLWKSVQMTSAYGMIVGNGNGNFGVNETVTRGTMAIVLARFLGLPASSTDEAINQLIARKITSATTVAGFNAGSNVTKGELAIFFDRALGQTVSDQQQAINHLASWGVSVGCSDSSCHNNTVTKGQLAETIAGGLYAGITRNIITFPKLPASSTNPVYTTPVSPNATPTSGSQIPTTAPANNPPNLGTTWVTQDYNPWAIGVNGANLSSEMKAQFYDNNGVGWGQPQSITLAGDRTWFSTQLPSNSPPSACNNGKTCVAQVGLVSVSGQLISNKTNVSLPAITTQIPPTVPPAASPTSGPSLSCTQDAGGYPTAKLPNIKGSFDGVDSQGNLIGWACDTSSPNTGIKVQFYANAPWPQGVYMTEGVANKTGESAIGGFCGNTTAHRFSVPLPAQYRNASTKIYAHGLNAGATDNSVIPWSNGRTIACTGGGGGTSSEDITVYASGTKANGQYANLELYINGSKVKTWTNITGDGNNFQTLTYSHSSNVTVSQIKLVFPNDAYENSSNDRNVKVQKVKVGSTEYLVSRGLTKVCGGTEKQATDGWMFCSNDYITFSGVTAQASGSNTNTVPVAAIPNASTTTSKPGNPVGWNDGVDNTGIARGWACDGDDYNQAIEVHLYIDGEWFNAPYPGSGATAIQPGEAAIGGFCGGTTDHRFTYQLPSQFKDGKTHNLYVYAINIGTGNVVMLNGSATSFVWR